MSMVHVEHWTALAKCRGTEDILFCEGAEQKRARLFCSGCPVRRECLAEALDNRIEWGIWGGMTERERRSLLRRNSEVTDWHRALRSRPVNDERSRSVSDERSRSVSDERSRSVSDERSRSVSG